MTSTKNNTPRAAQRQPTTRGASKPGTVTPRPSSGKGQASSTNHSSVDWTCVHFSMLKGYRRVYFGHRHSPAEHAALCQKLRDGKLGTGFYMQIEDPSASRGALREVLHPQDVARVNFDTLSSFLRAKPGEAETPQS